jgi:hypothetical protein
MIDDILSLQRRGFLQQTAGVVALAAVSAGSEAAGLVKQPRVLALYQEQDAVSVAFATALQQQGIAVQALGTDIVRLWRDQLRAQVVRDNVRLVGLTPYTDYFLLKGLAAEERIFPKMEARQTTAQVNAPDALISHMQEVLATVDQSSPANTTISASTEPSLFSWII